MRAKAGEVQFGEEIRKGGLLNECFESVSMKEKNAEARLWSGRLIDISGFTGKDLTCPYSILHVLIVSGRNTWFAIRCTRALAPPVTNPGKCRVAQEL